MGRAAVLFVGFYAVALAAVAALFYVGIAVIDLPTKHTGGHGMRGAALIALILFAAGAALLWTILPRRDRFVPADPPLDRPSSPALFAELERVARHTGRPIPAELYRTGDAVSIEHRGQLAGFGGRAVATIGDPLLDELTVSELRALIARELEHLERPWLFRFRAALAREVDDYEHRVRSDGHVISGAFRLLNLPHYWFARGLLRTTRAAAAERELAADQTAARVVGAATAIRALEQAALAGAPGAGTRDERLEAHHLRAISEPTDPADPRPSLRERIAALGGASPAGELAGADEPAASLIR